MEQFDATRKTTLKSHLCQARGDDAEGRTSTLMDEVYRFMEAMVMPVYQAERAQRAAEAASQGTTEMPVQDKVKGKCLTRIPWHTQSPIPEGITVTGDNIGASSGVYN